MMMLTTAAGRCTSLPLRRVVQGPCSHRRKNLEFSPTELLWPKFSSTIRQTPVFKPTNQRLLSNTSSSSSNSSTQQQQQQALHNEISEVMGKKAPAPSVAASSASLSDFPPEIRRQAQRSFWEKYWPGVVSFTLLVLSGQTLNAGIEKRKAQRQASELAALSEKRLVSCQTLLTTHTIDQFAQRMVKELRERQQSSSNKGRPRGGSFWSFGTSSAEDGTDNDDEQLKALFADAIREEYVSVLRESTALDAEQKALYIATVSKKPPQEPEQQEETESQQRNQDNNVEQMLEDITATLLTEEAGERQANKTGAANPPPPQGFSM